ncbi:MYG1 family protein [Thioclava sp. FR2]|uniref:MYG1 family protein n=1 Tax=Thioclava sp. FR2 TaxID=3445780 RepID=UPI003EBAC4DD
MTPDFLVTHSGGFHADDLMSTVVLTRLFPKAQLVRSRDDRWTTPAADRVIYDVGRDFDAGKAIFDHHQKNPPLRADGQPFSSFGLIWREYGPRYLAALNVPDADIPKVHAEFDQSFVLPIDLMDNGAIDPGAAGLLASLSLPVLLENLKPVFDAKEREAEDAAFAVAVDVARALVEAVLRQMTAKLRAEMIVRAAIERAGPSPILELPMGMPYREAIEKSGADHLLFVIHPRDSDWALNGIKISESSFAQRADLPAEWAGLTDAALELASGVKGAKFCHNARFIAVADSREAIIQMAELAVRSATKG